LTCYGATWTPSIGANEAMPITCLDWYSALAFCIWDGRRLPTEAEWNYAASGGAEQRVYPWSSPPTDTTISSFDAVYEANGLAFVGSTTQGAGRWGHWDLAGNAEEWVRDVFVDPYASTSLCINCANFSGSSNNALRGGNFYDFPSDITASARDSYTPDSADVVSVVGVRCARTP
jgi:formylglycine-generating enzyme required for sulfatase activity